MYKCFRVVIILLCFIFLGEVLLTINHNYNLLTLEKRQKVNYYDYSAHNYVLNKDKIDSLRRNLDFNNFRIMILGDSRLLGFGLSKENSFKNKLEQYLQNEVNFEIFDYSGMSFNIFNNYLTFKKHFNSIEPNLVILGWNHDDLLGNPAAKYIEYAKGINSTFEKENKGEIEKKKRSIISELKYCYANSQFLTFLKATILHYVHKLGLSVPVGNYNKIINHLYYQDSRDWQYANKILSYISTSLSREKSTLIILNIPDFDIINRKGLKRIDQFVAQTFKLYKNTIYIDTKDFFLNEYKKTLSISKYDGHPNLYTIDKISYEISKVVHNIYYD